MGKGRNGRCAAVGWEWEGWGQEGGRQVGEGRLKFRGWEGTGKGKAKRESRSRKQSKSAWGWMRMGVPAAAQRREIGHHLFHGGEAMPTAQAWQA